jgi:hypothetical protein
MRRISYAQYIALLGQEQPHSIGANILRRWASTGTAYHGHNILPRRGKSSSHIEAVQTSCAAEAISPLRGARSARDQSGDESPHSKGCALRQFVRTAAASLGQEPHCIG